MHGYDMNRYDMNRYDMNRYDMTRIRQVPKTIVRKSLTKAFEHHTNKFLPSELFLEIWNKIEWSYEPDDDFIYQTDEAYADFLRRSSTKHKRNGKKTVRLKRAWKMFDI
jgi:hypothetical protein